MSAPAAAARAVLDAPSAPQARGSSDERTVR